MAFERMALVLGRWILHIMLFYIAYSVVLYIFVMLIRYFFMLIVVVGFIIIAIKLIECSYKNDIQPFMELMIVWPFQIAFQLIRLPWKLSNDFTKEVAEHVPDKMGFIFLASSIAASVTLAPVATMLMQRALGAMSVLVQELTGGGTGGVGSW